MRKFLILIILILAGCQKGLKESDYPREIFQRQIEATDILLEYDSKGVIIPLYLYPGEDRQQEFERIATMKLTHPELPIIVIVNPHNGPGDYDEHYDDLIDVYDVLGITTIGYIYADYSNRPLEVIEEEMNTFNDLYPELDGYFIDEVDDSGNYEYYEKLLEYAGEKDFLVGNPGTEVDVEYYDIFSIMIIAEKNYEKMNDAYFDEESFYQVAPFQKGVIVHHADEMESLFLLEHVNWIYSTEYDSYRQLTHNFEDYVESIMEMNEG